MLPSVTVSFLLGLILGSYTPYTPTLTLSLLVIAGLFLTWLERKGPLSSQRSLLIYSVLLVGALISILSARVTADSRLLETAGGDQLRIVGTVTQPVYRAPRRLVLVIDATHAAHAGRAFEVDGRIRLTWREPDRSFRRGDHIQFSARIRAPSGPMNPGGFNYGAYLTRQGIHGVASVSGPGAVQLSAQPPTLSRWGPWRLIDRWRAEIHEAAVASLTGPALGIYLGIIVGERGYILPEVRDAFMATGTVHILSISGSHLGLVAFLSFVLVRALCAALPTTWFQVMSRRITPSRLAALATVLPVTFYTLLAGAEVATVRSLVMILVFLLATWLGRERALIGALACAALLILLYDPSAIWDISFQLSFLSVLAIALVIRWFVFVEDDDSEDGSRALSHRARKWAVGYVGITVGVTLVTAPLVAYYFNQIPWLGLVANALIVPLAGFALVPLGLCSAVWLLIAGGESLPAAALNQFVLDAFIETVGILAQIPGAEWHVASPTIPAILIFYLLLFVAARPGHGLWRQWGRAGCALATLLIVGWWVWSPRDLPDGESFRVTYLDVGQGDATLIELPHGETVLIDGGARYDTLDMGRAVVGPYLWDRGIRRLDHVISTHPQLDHIGGLPWILNKFEVGHYWGNGVEREAPFYRRLQKALRAQGLVEQSAEEGEAILRDDHCQLHVLNPPPSQRYGGDVLLAGSQARRSGTQLNNLSVVTSLTCGSQSFLFTADIETDAMRRLGRTGLLERIRVLKVPHHGAKSSFNAAWLEQVTANMAVISAGRQNAYRHPAERVVRAYERKGIELFRTDRDGAVWITARPSSPHLHVHTASGGLPEPVWVGAGMFASERENLARIRDLWRGP